MVLLSRRANAELVPKIHTVQRRSHATIPKLTSKVPTKRGPANTTFSPTTQHLPSAAHCQHSTPSLCCTLPTLNSFPLMPSRIAHKYKLYLAELRVTLSHRHAGSQQKQNTSYRSVLQMAVYTLPSRGPGSRYKLPGLTMLHTFCCSR